MNEYEIVLLKGKCNKKFVDTLTTLINNYYDNKIIPVFHIDKINDDEYKILGAYMDYSHNFKNLLKEVAKHNEEHITKLSIDYLIDAKNTNNYYSYEGGNNEN